MSYMLTLKLIAFLKTGLHILLKGRVKCYFSKKCVRLFVISAPQKCTRTSQT